MRIPKSLTVDQFTNFRDRNLIQNNKLNKSESKK